LTYAELIALKKLDMLEVIGLGLPNQ
jgi:hypothetical protein